MLATDENGRPYVKRAKAVTVQAAENRFKKHSSGPGPCPNSTEASGRCPGRWDPYDRKHACLIRAVLREDWDQLRRKADGRDWERELTTEAGYWKDDPL